MIFNTAILDRVGPIFLKERISGAWGPARVRSGQPGKVGSPTTGDLPLGLK